MGLVKPDREAFEFAIEGLDCSADSILFLDDNVINVEAARAAGLRAEVTRGPGEARTVLAAYGPGTRGGHVRSPARFGSPGSPEGMPLARPGLGIQYGPSRI